jgi:cytosine/adenosine deaminase-related metal-dependent hydrolase
MENKKLLIKNAWICRPENNSIIPEFGNMVIEDGIITKIIKGDVPLSYNDFKIIDAGGKVITLPNVNYHDHIYSRLAKGLPSLGPTESFSEILENLWWKLDMVLDYDMIKASAEMAATESIRNGVTYIFDHHASPANTPGSLNYIKDALCKNNIRSVLCFETSDRNGEKLKTDALKENNNYLLNECNKDCKGLFGLHASFTLDDSTLNEVKRMIEESGAGIHIHVCEGEADRELSIKKYGKNPLQRLLDFNLVNDKSILAHGVHLNREEFNALKEKRPAIVFNLDSNQNNSVGIPPLNFVPDEVSILCGTDGMHANIARSQKQFFLMLRSQKNTFGETFRLFQKMYFDQLNFVKKYFTDFSSLNEGDRADLIIWDYNPPTPINKDNFFGHYIYGIMERNIETVVQNGKILMDNYKIMNINEAEINEEISLQGKRVVEKISQMKS